LNGDVMMCSGHPWIDVRCNGAIGDGAHDDTSAIQTTINTAIANNWPVQIPSGTYKLTSRIAIDYAGQSGKGFRLISHGATLDGRTIAAGEVLKVQCSGGTPASPANCFYFRQEGTLFVNASTPDYAVRIGSADFSDAHNSLKLDHLIVNNASTASAAGGLQLNYVLDSDIFAIATAPAARRAWPSSRRNSPASPAPARPTAPAAPRCCSKTALTSPTRSSPSTWKLRHLSRHHHGP